VLPVAGGTGVIVSSRCWNSASGYQTRQYFFKL